MITGLLLALLLLSPDVGLADDQHAPEPAGAAPEAAPQGAVPPKAEVVRADTEMKRKALKAMAVKRGFVMVKKGDMLCTDGRIGRGFIIAGDRRKDHKQPVNIYDITDHHQKARQLKTTVPVYVTRSEDQRGIELLYDDIDRGVVSYRVFECKLKLK